MRRTHVVTSGSLDRFQMSQLHDPGGFRTHDLRIKRCQADSVGCEAISAYDIPCDGADKGMAPDAPGASIRRGSLRGHPKPLDIGGAWTWGGKR